MVGRAFQQGSAFLASMDGAVLKVPLEKEPPRIPLHARGLLTDWLLNRTEYARFNLDRLAHVSYDSNDRHRWFDIAEQNGYSLRLQFPVHELGEKETAVLSALADRVTRCGLKVGPGTRRALGISDYLP